jgi:phosphopentomutase
MPKQSHPATKEDIRLLMESLGQHADATQRQIREVEERMTKHFDLAIEIVRHDLEGAHRDRLANYDQKLDRHDARLHRVERQLGLAANA